MNHAIYSLLVTQVRRGFPRGEVRVVCWREHRVIVVFVWLPAARMEGGTVVVHTHSLTFREEEKEPGFPEPPVPRFDTEPVLSPLSRVFETAWLLHPLAPLSQIY